MPPAQLWEALSRTGDYPLWWSWLTRFDAGALEPGTEARCVVRGPLPYTLRFSVHVHSVVPERLIDADVTGDIEGPAHLAIEPAGDGRSNARLHWVVEVKDPLLRAGAVFGRPLMQWGHEWVVSTGVSQFRRRALRPAP